MIYRQDSRSIWKVVHFWIFPSTLQSRHHIGSLVVVGHVSESADDAVIGEVSVVVVDEDVGWWSSEIKFATISFSAIVTSCRTRWMVASHMSIAERASACSAEDICLMESPKIGLAAPTLWYEEGNRGSW
jgi:hypothetical protein